MTSRAGTLTRRDFLRASALAVPSLAIPVRSGNGRPRRREVQLGFDNFSIREWGWKAPQLLDFAQEERLDTVLFSDLDVYEHHDAAYLREIRNRADRQGIAIQGGTGSICPSSVTFDDRFGSADEHLALTIRVAELVGSNVARCYLGNASDRAHERGIGFHMENTAAVCRRAREQALAAGVTIAIENHAGDMQARELVRLIEAAGPDFVGATVDSGNAAWTLEDPMNNLRILGPYAASSGIRDVMVWPSDDGAFVQWTAMGEGQIDLHAYMDQFAELAPGVPVQLEIISGFARNFPYLDPDFWGPYSDVRAQDFAGFVALARNGRPTASFEVPEGVDRREAQRAYQMAELTRSIVYSRDVLGLGLKR